ncbi:hypothetical protein [Nocardia cyriacigeorgica]|uniref:hypothetical protein n=1 Tax=Nocardia cyriacigeorgica TaxID=135487 RepID=UPI0024540976|nr:hypothetical protein [Nocardia cyriacigeorgica]
MNSAPSAGPAPTAIADYYRSVDSAPAGYSVDRPASASNGFLISFTGLTVIAMCLQAVLHQTDLVERNDLVILAGDRGNVAMPTRIFIVVFFVTYAAYAYSNRWRRLFLGVSLLGKFLASCVFFDVLAWLLDDLGLLRISVFGQQVASALVALAIFPHTVLRQARLPEPVRMTISPRTPAMAYVKLFVPFTLALALAAVFEQAFLDVVLDLRDWRCSVVWVRESFSPSRSSRP